MYTVYFILFVTLWPSTRIIWRNNSEKTKILVQTIHPLQTYLKHNENTSKVYPYASVYDLIIYAYLFLCYWNIFLDLCYVVMILCFTISFIRRFCYFNALPDEKTQYKFQKFGKFQLIYFSLLNFKDLFNVLPRISIFFIILNIHLFIFAPHVPACLAAWLDIRISFGARREIDFWFLFNQLKSVCTYHLPINLEPNEIQDDVKSIGKA